MSAQIGTFMSRFMVRIVPLLVVAAALGCSTNAHSQKQAPAAAVSDSVTQSRRNAITRAVEFATPAIVSVNVIEVRRFRYRDPFSEFFNDPFFAPFFQERRSRVIERQVQNLGSGFVISPDGYVVTNDHVVTNATRITISFTDGQTLEAKLVGTDEVSDLALVKVDPQADLPYLSFAADGDPIVGEWAIALGNPFGLFEAAEPTVTVGVISAAGRDLGSRDGHFYTDMIQTDASINRGNSGGPLVNAQGDVIGVNTAIYSESGGSVGLGFAVPAWKAQRIIEELRTDGRVDRAYYDGLLFTDVTDRIAEALSLHRVRGVLVVEVVAGSPAAEAGFTPYDVIVEVEREPIVDRSDYMARLYDFRPHDAITYGIIRDGNRIDIVMTIGRKSE